MTWHWLEARESERFDNPKIFNSPTTKKLFVIVYILTVIFLYILKVADKHYWTELLDIVVLVALCGTSCNVGGSHEQ